MIMRIPWPLNKENNTVMLQNYSNLHYHVWSSHFESNSIHHESGWKVVWHFSMAKDFPNHSKVLKKPVGLDFHCPFISEKFCEFPWFKIRQWWPVAAVELADYLWWRPPGCLSLPRIHGSSPNSGPEWAWSGLWSTSSMLPLFGRENSCFLLPEICIWDIDYSQNKFISGLTSAYMGLHYLLIICHYTRVVWVAPHHPTNFGHFCSCS